MCFLPQLKYKEVYQRTKSTCTIEPDAVQIKAAKDAYKVNTNVSSRNVPKPKRGSSASVGHMASFDIFSSDWVLVSPDQGSGPRTWVITLTPKCCPWFLQRTVGKSRDSPRMLYPLSLHVTMLKNGGFNSEMKVTFSTVSPVSMFFSCHKL